MRRQFQPLTLLAIAAAFALAPASCKKSDSGEEDEPSEGASAEAEGTGEAAAATVTVELDGEKVATVEAEQLGERLPLAEVLGDGAPPTEDWMTVELHGAGDELASFSKPEKFHPGHTVAFFLTSDGEPALGIFAADAATPKVWHGPLERVAVKTREPELADGERRPGPEGIVVDRNGEETLVGFDVIETLDSITAPLGDPETPGWSVPTILSQAGGLDGVKKVTLDAGGGDAIELTAAQLRDPNVITFIKRNRRGQLRIRVWEKKGEDYSQLGELRGLDAIRVQ